MIGVYVGPSRTAVPVMILRLLASSTAHSARTRPWLTALTLTHSHYRPSISRRPHPLGKRRSFTTSIPGSTPTSFPDPSRPDIFYHLVGPPTPLSSHRPAFAISFLPSPSPSPNSCTIIGWLPAAAGGADAESDSEAGLNDFVENSDYIFFSPFVV